MENNKPLDKVRAGSVTAAIWENEVTVKGKPVTMLKTTIERRFTDARGNWKSSNSFSRNELPLAIFCLTKAFEKIVAEEQQADSTSEEFVR